MLGSTGPDSVQHVSRHSPNSLLFANVVVIALVASRRRDDGPCRGLGRGKPKRYQMGPNQMETREDASAEFSAGFRTPSATCKSRYQILHLRADLRLGLEPCQRQVPAPLVSARLPNERTTTVCAPALADIADKHPMSTPWQQPRQRRSEEVEACQPNDPLPRPC